MTEELFIYTTGPIDFWDGWHQIKATDLGPFGSEDEIKIPLKVYKLFKLAFSQVKSWEGDIRGDDVYYTGTVPHTPDDFTCTYMVGWKQDNNGQTFIASESPIFGWHEALEC